MGIKVGEIISDYQVIRELGAGGMGAVYEVKHLISHRTEAMKLLLPSLEAKPDLAQRFLREIRVHASLTHPAIATLHTALRHEDQLLMVMEFVPGESLDVRLRRSPLQTAEALTITSQLLRALAYAHSRSVIHRDIKPANIMLLRDTEVKLLDFGIARPLVNSGLTEVGAAIGSLHYMSPEQLRGLPIDQRSDLYSTGVTLYEMLTGQRPFSGDDPYSVMRAKLETTARPVNELNPTISVELSCTVAQALERDPDKRLQTADEFSQRLEACQVPVPQHTAPPSVTSAVLDSRTPSSPRAAVVLFEPEALERVTSLLATFIGPVARLLVSRTARKTASWNQLYQSLAAEVPGGPDRDKFLAACNSVLFGGK